MHYSKNERLYEIEKMMRGIPNFRERGHGSLVLQTDIDDLSDEKMQKRLWKEGTFEQGI